MRRAKLRIHVVLLMAAVGILLACALGACGALKRSLLVGGAAGLGATAGTALAGPPGGVAGAVVLGTAANGVVEADAREKHADALEERVYVDCPPRMPEPPPPPWYARVPLWGWLALLVLWLKRSHVWDALTGRQPRFDAILRAIGWRTHRWRPKLRVP